MTRAPKKMTRAESERFMLNKQNMHRYTREALYKLQGPRCNLCRADDVFLEVDHLVPLCLGGTDNLVNLQLLCSRCNNIKSGYTPEQLRERGYPEMAMQLTQIQAERSRWTDAHITGLLQVPPPVFKPKAYACYALIINREHAFGAGLTAKMLDRGISETRLVRELRQHVGSCFHGNIRRWRWKHYPSPVFFQALSIVLDWPIKAMCKLVDFGKYGKALRHEPLHDLMPYLLQHGWGQTEAATQVLANARKRDALKFMHIQRYFSNGILITELLPALTRTFPQCSEPFFYNRANETLTLEALRLQDKACYLDGYFPKRHRLAGAGASTKTQYIGMLTFIKLALFNNGYMLPTLEALALPGLHRVQRQLLQFQRLSFRQFALLSLLGDFTIHDIPEHYLYPNWNLNEIALRCNLALKALIRQELKDRGIALTAGTYQALGIAAGALTNALNAEKAVNVVRTRAIPKAAFKQIREFFRWIPPAPILPCLSGNGARYEKKNRRA